MGNRVPGDGAVAISRARQKIDRWRRWHRPRARIPEELWRAAVELAGLHGVHRIARALRLDYYRLQKRMAAPAASRGSASEFVELLPGGIPASRPECLIEIEDPGGAKLRIHLQGGEFPDVAVLARGFREGGS